MYIRTFPRKIGGSYLKAMPVNLLSHSHPIYLFRSLTKILSYQVTFLADKFCNKDNMNLPDQ